KCYTRRNPDRVKEGYPPRARAIKTLTTCTAPPAECINDQQRPQTAHGAPGNVKMTRPGSHPSQGRVPVLPRSPETRTARLSHSSFNGTWGTPLKRRNELRGNGYKGARRTPFMRYATTFS